MKSKIALIKLSALGDIAHAALVPQLIKAKLASAHITWVADSRFEQAARLINGVDEVLALPIKDGKLKKSLELIKKAGKFDIAIDMQGLLKSAIISKMLSPLVAGFSFSSAKERVASFFYSRKFKISYNANIINRNTLLAAFALEFSLDKSEILNKKPCFKFSPQKPQQNGKKRILIAPFASEPSKAYQGFKDVINSLAKEHELYVCYWGESEHKIALSLTQNSSAKPVSMELKDMISFISHCDLIIGNDSGISHIAWAQNRPSITLFGNRPARRNSYETLINISIAAPTKRPINARKIDKSNLCINNIPPAKIINEAKRLLK